jgi:glucosyl-dolichyl phosphate glucuronosyltransferase
MFLSVIIPTRNRARYLEGALSSLRGQTYSTESFEVLVVDNGSSDDTPEVCRSFGAFVPHFQYLYDSRPGLHIGRHLGLKRAQADILVYADDDIEASPAWLEGIAEAFHHEQVALAGGKDLPKFESEPPVWIDRMWRKNPEGARTLPYLSLLDLGDETKEVGPDDVFGCNFSIRKSVLLEAGGFHPDAMPDELIRYRGDGETHVARYIMQKGYKTLFHPKASVYHRVPVERMTVGYVCRRAWLQGVSDSYTAVRDGRGPWFSYTVRLHRTVKRLVSRKPASTFISHYLKGFFYHQGEVKKDPALREWVMKSSYLD